MSWKLKDECVEQDCWNFFDTTQKFNSIFEVTFIDRIRVSLNRKLFKLLIYGKINDFQVWQSAGKPVQ